MKPLELRVVDVPPGCEVCLRCVDLGNGEATHAEVRVFYRDGPLIRSFTNGTIPLLEGVWMSAGYFELTRDRIAFVRIFVFRELARDDRVHLL